MKHPLPQLKRTLRGFVVLMVPLLCLWFASGCGDGKKASKFVERGEAFLKEGAMEKAKIEFLNALRLENTNVVAMTRLSEIFTDQGAMLQAIPVLMRVRELTPNNMGARTRLAYALLSNNDVPRAREEIQTVLSRQPTNDAALLMLAFSARGEEQITQTLNQLGQIRQATGERAGQSLALAHLLQRRRDNPGASNAFLRALALDPNSYKARIGLANMMPGAAQAAAVEEMFKTAAQQAPARTPERIAYAEFLMSRGRPEQAIEALKPIIAETSDYIPAKRLMANLLLSEKKTDDAMRNVEDVLRIEPMNFEAQVLRAQIYMSQGKHTAAVESLERIEKSFAPLATLKHQIAIAHLLAKDPVKARKSIEQAYLLDGNSVPIVQLKAQLDMRFGEPTKAVAALQPIARRLPNATPIHALLGDAFMASGRTEDAFNTYRHLISNDPTNAALHFSVGYVLRHAGKDSEARRAFQTARQLDGSMAEAIHQLAEMELEDGKPAAAHAQLATLTAKEKESASTLAMQARVLMVEKKWDEAEGSLKKAIELEPESSSYYYLLAGVYTQSKQGEKAIKQLETLLASNPREVRALMLMGILATEKMDYKKARDAYEKILEQDRTHVPALNNLAFIHSISPGELGKAMGYAQRARTQAPDDPHVADTMAWIMFQQKQYAEALPLLRQSVARLRSYPEIQYHLGMTCYMLAQEADARAAFQLALASKSPFPEREDAQRRFDLLSKPASAVTAAELAALLKQSPDDPVALARQGGLLEDQRDFTGAAKSYQRILDASPKAFSAMANLARLNAGPLQNKAKAAELMEQARKLSPGDPGVSALAGRVAFDTGSHQEAYNALREASLTLTNSASVAMDLGWAAYSLGREAEGIAQMQKALNLDANLALANSAKWVIAITPALRDPAALAKLEPQLSTLLRSEPNHVAGLMAQAGLLLQKSDTTKAASIYEKILSVYPEFSPAKRLLAIIYADVPGQEAKATALAVKAREAIPGDPDLAFALGKLTYRKKDFTGAQGYLQEAVAKRPNDPDILYYLGMSMLQGRDAARGRQTLEKAISAGLKEPLAQEARKAAAAAPKL
ncbi:MAG: tetratricopeptide repeat protein [Verrucomicrobia bacterium]|nr:tetratricopeptide repeat protein [Verrucomicrobiota bacterium]